MRSCFLLYPPAPLLSRLQNPAFRRAIPSFADPRSVSHIRLSKDLNLRAADKLPVGANEEEDEACPVDCVREFNTEEEFSRALEQAKATKSLVVVLDFFRTSCGSCKYIKQGFS